jgi:hypothetical protein
VINKYQFTDPVSETVVTVALEGKTVDSISELVYEGKDKNLVQEIQSILSQSAGIYGHLIGKRTSLLDLSIAMKKPELEFYSPKLIEGEIPASGSKLPKGVQS